MNQLSRRRRRGRSIRPDRLILAVILIIAVNLLIILVVKKIDSGVPKEGNNNLVDVTPDSQGSASGESQGADVNPDKTEEPTLVELNPHATEGTSPEAFGMTYELELDGERVSSYNAEEPFNFKLGSQYTDIEGIISFRGNSFRDGGSYGRISGLDVQYGSDGKPVWGNILEDVWHSPTYSLKKGLGGDYSGSWTGSGWTGQPIIVKWDRETKQHMNMADWAKADDNMVEVIYATMDGCIYFLDLQTGKATRNKLELNIPFKGAGSLDPRGYPVLYLGAGDSYDLSSDRRPAKAMAINLLDCSILFEFGQKPDSFAIRGWTAYDSSALVCAENDSLIYPGENGILYVMKLNTVYDKEAGTITMNPSRMVKMRYSSEKDRNKGFQVGYEGSAAAYSHYVFLTENSGLMHCVDLNTMKVVWAQDISDDTNSSPVFSVENGKCYLYIGNTIDSTMKAVDSNGDGKGTTSFYKIDAETGEIVWQIDEEIYTNSHITGGVMTSAIVGKGKAQGRVYFVFSSFSYYSGGNGKMMCVNTDDGSVIWQGPLSTYTWSSPAPIYDSEDNLYFVQCNSGGNVYLVDGCSDTYERSIIDKLPITPSTNIEASPAVYEDMIVIGTRISGIHGIRIKTK